jgi:preprotein translocase subunit SecG
MQTWMTILLVAQIMTALAIIVLVLLQHGKGADVGVSFGGGASAGSLFGASGSANFLSRTTAVLATVFFLCTIALAYMANTRAHAPAGGPGTGVLERPLPAPVQPGQPAAPAPGQIPGVAPAPVTPPAGGGAVIPTN